MMEKYGTDFDSLPATDEQYSLILKLQKEGKLISMPKTRKEADELIESITKTAE